MKIISSMWHGVVSFYTHTWHFTVTRLIVILAMIFVTLVIVDAINSRKSS